MAESLLRAVHGADRHCDQDGAGRLFRQAQGTGADPQLRVGRGQHRRGRIRPGGARKPAREGRSRGRPDRPAAAAHGARLLHHELFARHQPGLPQGPLPERRPAELGRFLEREEISRRALPVRPLIHVPRDGAAGRRRAGRQALSDGHRARLPQDGRDQAASADVVARRLAVAAAHPRSSSSATARST